MNDKIQDSLISAYHDGELSAAERVGVEHLLASSPEARAELESYRRQSGLLRESGRPTLTADLAPLVMHTIEQRMLLPQTAARPQAISNGSNWGSGSWAGALVALTAAMMVAVSFLPQGNRTTVMPREAGRFPSLLGNTKFELQGGHLVDQARFPLA